MSMYPIGLPKGSEDHTFQPRQQTEISSSDLFSSIEVSFAGFFNEITEKITVIYKNFTDKNCYINNLPTDTLVPIANHLNPQDYVHFFSTCTYLNHQILQSGQLRQLFTEGMKTAIHRTHIQLYSACYGMRIATCQLIRTQCNMALDGDFFSSSEHTNALQYQEKRIQEYEALQKKLRILSIRHSLLTGQNKHTNQPV